MKYLLIIDVQNDFITGALGTDAAVEILPRLLAKAAQFDGKICMTKDTHTGNYLDTQEGKLLPIPHCLVGTEGWDFPVELEQLQKTKNAAVYEKPCFGSTALVKDLSQACERGELDSIELTGLCTDICVVSNALMLKAAMPEIPIYVDASCCAGVTVQKHEAALVVMESCQIQINNRP